MNNYTIEIQWSCPEVVLVKYAVTILGIGRWSLALLGLA